MESLLFSPVNPSQSFTDPPPIIEGPEEERLQIFCQVRVRFAFGCDDLSPNKPVEVRVVRLDTSTNEMNSAIYDDGYLRVEYDNYYVTCRNMTIYSLSRKEFFVLTAILRGNGRPVRNQDIWHAVWGETDECKDEVLRAHITNLRRKLTPYGIQIASMIGVGYYLQIRPREVTTGAADPVR